MKREELERRVRAIVEDQRTLDPGVLDSGATLADAGIDSLDALNILYEIESEFHIAIDDEEARGFSSFSELVDLVQNKISQQPS